MEYWNEALETMPWPEVERWQALQIASAMPGIQTHSILYSTLHCDVARHKIRRFEDLQLFPFTLKDQIRCAQEQASTAQPFGDNQTAPQADILQVVSSSGTTGNPLYFPLTENDVAMQTDAIANSWFTAGLRRNDIVAHLVGLPMVAGGLPYADGFRRIGATLCWLGGFPTDRILREIRRLRVTALLATTSFGVYLSEQTAMLDAETGIASSLKKVLCGGEPGLDQPSIRQRIQTGLGISHLREVMGLGDIIPAMWAECEFLGGMHFNAQRYVAIELIDPETGEVIPWTEGASGEIVYTSFAREAAPLVRYRSRDHVRITGIACPCGRTSPRMRCIGRTDDMMIYKGMNVFPTALRDVIVSRFSPEAGPTIRLWKERADQVRFDLPIDVDIEISDGIRRPLAALAAEIEAEVRAQLQVRISANLVPEGSLPRSNYKNSLVAIKQQ